MTSAANEPRDVRGEDAFAAAAVADWLRGQGVDVAGEPGVRQFSGGASNLTYQLTWPDRELILRRPPAGTKSRGAHDMKREHDLQAALAGGFALVPRMVAYCGDESVIGSEFYVMEKVPGLILRRDMPADITEDQVRTLCERAVDTLADLHAADVEALGLGGLSRGDGYVRRQVEGWAKRYAAARTPDVGDYEAVIGWLRDNQPGDVGQCLIHNDFRFDNLVLDEADPTTIRGVLDWELATVGDPLMDLGSSLAYWVEAGDDKVFQAFRRQPTNAPGMLTRAEVVERYAARTGLTVTPQQWRFYDVFGLFRLAGIAQQIHYRYFHGQTTNEAFAEFRQAVIYLEQRCLALMNA